MYHMSIATEDEDKRNWFLANARGLTFLLNERRHVDVYKEKQVV